MTIWSRSSLRLTFTAARIAGSNCMGLHPALQQGGLPQAGMAFGAQSLVRLCGHSVYIRSLKQPPRFCRGLIQNVPHQLEKRTAQVSQRGHGEVALRPVDDLGWHKLSSGLLANVVSTILHLHAGSDTGRTFPR